MLKKLVLKIVYKTHLYTKHSGLSDRRPEKPERLDIYPVVMIAHFYESSSPNAIIFELKSIK